MAPASKLVKNVIDDFDINLKGIYPAREIRQFVYMLFEEFMGWQKTKIHLSPDAAIPNHTINLFTLALTELINGKPIQYILKRAWFGGILLKVDEHVLIPRPETEELCSIIKSDQSRNVNKQISILDIGTGSGCIAINLKKHFVQAEITAVDCSANALNIAAENATANDCTVFFKHADILDQLKWNMFGNFNLIVSNPPYVLDSEKTAMHRNVTEFEPDQALYVRNQDPLVFYRAICGFASTHLILRGSLYVEINEKFGREVSEMFSSFGFKEVRILLDFFGKERFIAGISGAPAGYL